MTLCRVCGDEFQGEVKWKEHVEIEKKKFCLIKKIPVEHWYKVHWELVVEHYNPDMAKSSNTLKELYKPQFKLNDFKN